ncbi:hypothetical protein E2C01_060028 [Portunus trituberculatus]|uniref:Uncharacterized protein n=1 Tax=Portunus trituberculatus TaxID=210409 RepID=A0A5B7H144_PORTR|nr:hypothetical protein [Portunus trituberculatus]
MRRSEGDERALFHTSLLTVRRVYLRSLSARRVTHQPRSEKNADSIMDNDGPRKDSREYKSRLWWWW